MSASKHSMTTSNRLGMGCCAQVHYRPVSCLCAPNMSMMSDSVYNMVKRVSLTKAPHYLTAQQRKRVERTWSELSVEMSLLGLDCMTTLWQQCPAVPAIFQLPALYSKDLHRNPRFHQHACWMVQAVSAAVENFDKLDKLLEDTFLEIGIKHAAVPNFPGHTFAALPEVWATVWEQHLSGRFTGQTEKSWGKLFLFISNRLTEGYQQCTLIDDLNERSLQQYVTFDEKNPIPFISSGSKSGTIRTKADTTTNEDACSAAQSVEDADFEGPDVREEDSNLTIHSNNPGGRKISRAKQRHRMRSAKVVHPNEPSENDASLIANNETTTKKTSVSSNFSFFKKSSKVSASSNQ